MAIVRNLCRICDITVKPETQLSAVFRIFAAFEVGLVISTWPLWWGHGSFPVVPLLPVFPGIIWSQVFTGLLLVSAILIVLWPMPAKFGKSVTQWAAAVALSTGLSLVVLNQHRLQPWHWLFLLTLAWMLMLPRNAPLTVMRHTICTVYVCSALSRISSTPLSGMTGAIVFKSLEMLGFAELSPDSRLPMAFCHGLILGELTVGLLLLPKKTRKAGSLGAILLHLTLLIVLGPLGLNHHAGVLLWNLCFLAVVPVLFRSDKSSSVDDTKWSVRARTATIVTWLFPLSGLIGLADNWPSWQLYSSRPETWILLVHRDDCIRLPPALADFIGEPPPFSDWSPIKLDRWSLAETGSPLYPEDRFQLAVCRAILSGVNEDFRFRIEVSEPVTPFWWKRHRRSITSHAELEQETKRYDLNSTAAD